MTSTPKESEILKTDKRGRVRMTLGRRQELLEEFAKSGLSAPKFATVTGLKYQTLAGWLHQRRKQRDKMAPTVHPAKEPTVQWLETVIEKAQATQAVPRACLQNRYLIQSSTAAMVNIQRKVWSSFITVRLKAHLD